MYIHFFFLIADLIIHFVTSLVRINTHMNIGPNSSLLHKLLEVLQTKFHADDLWEFVCSSKTLVCRQLQIPWFVAGH